VCSFEISQNMKSFSRPLMDFFFLFGEDAGFFDDKAEVLDLSLDEDLVVFDGKVEVLDLSLDEDPVVSDDKVEVLG
jgi:hypothetical protein